MVWVVGAEELVGLGVLAVMVLVLAPALGVLVLVLAPGGLDADGTLATASDPSPQADSPTATAATAVIHGDGRGGIGYSFE